MFRAIAFGGASPLQHLETLGEMETLHQRWENWQVALEIYITDSGVSKKVSESAALLLTDEEDRRQIWKTFTEKQKADQ